MGYQSGAADRTRRIARELCAPHPQLGDRTPVEIIREVSLDEQLFRYPGIASLGFGDDPRTRMDLRKYGPVLVAGADVWKKQWVVVVLEDGVFSRAFVAPTIDDVVADLSDAVAMGVDMPIGLPTGGESRRADQEARSFVRPRGSSVFSTPSAELLEKESAAEANDLAKANGWPGVSAQSFALKAQIEAVQPLAESNKRLWEVHPEVSFREAHGRPLEWAKSTWNGVSLRRQILERQGIILPADLKNGGKADVADVLDAAIAAWSAGRIAAGEAQSLPANSPRIGAIWR